MPAPTRVKVLLVFFRVVVMASSAAWCRSSAPITPFAPGLPAMGAREFEGLALGLSGIPDVPPRPDDRDAPDRTAC